MASGGNVGTQWAEGGAQTDIVHTILSGEGVRGLVAAGYAVASAQRCELLWPGLNDTYRLTTTADVYIVRVYGARSRTCEDVAYELDLLIHLAKKGVPVSTPIPTKDGVLLRTIAAPEGERQVALFTYARGEPLRWSRVDQNLLAGQLIGRIHAAAEGFREDRERFCLDRQYLIDAPLAALRPFLDQRPNDWKYLESVAERLGDRLDRAARAGLDWGVCHGDFNDRNIHVDADGAPTVFDFDLCGAGWRAYDFVAAHRVARYYRANKVWRLFLRGYNEVRRLKKVDQAAVPLFHGISRLWSIGMNAQSVGRQGAIAVSDGNLDHALRSIREWEEWATEDLEGWTLQSVRGSSWWPVSKSGSTDGRAGRRSPPSGSARGGRSVSRTGKKG